MRLTRSEDVRVQSNAIHVLAEMALSGALLHPRRFHDWLIGSRELQAETRGCRYHP